MLLLTFHDSHISVPVKLPVKLNLRAKQVSFGSQFHAMVHDEDLLFEDLGGKVLHAGKGNIAQLMTSVR